MKPASTDVLIVGAGPAGLALAIELARRHIAFHLIDKAAAPFDGSRGKGIQPRSLEVFEDQGLVDRLVALGGPYPTRREYDGEGRTHDSPMIEAPVLDPHVPFPSPLMIPQFVTERVMRERLAELGHAPRYSQALVGLEQDDDTVTAHIQAADGVWDLRCRYLIAADGGQSFVRHALAIDFPGRSLGVRSIVADIEASGLEHGFWHQWLNGTAQQLAICTLPGSPLFQLQAAVPLEGDVDLSDAGLQTLVGERTRHADIRIAAVHWRSVYSMSARLAERFRMGRVFLIGDAAHVHPPAGGQGLNTSVQDAYNLGWKLAAVLGGAPDSLLDTFESERRPIAAAMLELSTGLLERFKKVGIAGGSTATRQLDIGYRTSVLTLHRIDENALLRAGDRAPDAVYEGAAGQPRRLHELFRGIHWTLLAFEVADAAVPRAAPMQAHRIGPGADLRERADAVYPVPTGTFVLVRPDGYIGAMVPAAEADALVEYVARLAPT